MSKTASGPMMKNCAFASSNSAYSPPQFEPVSLRDFYRFRHRRLSGIHNAFQVSPDNRKLNADVTRIVFPVDERRAAGFFDAGELGKRNLLSAGSGNKKVPNLARAGTELRLHSNDEVKEFFSLDDLRGSLSPDSRLHDRFDIGDVDPVTRDFLAIGVDDQAGLAEFANDRELGKTW